MSLTAMQMIQEAKAAVPMISIDETRAIMGNDDVIIIDVRDYLEVANSGKIKGAHHISRGMLEFHADDAMPMHNSELSKHKTIIVYCASGGRSALAGFALKKMGFTDVRNLGGFPDWVARGGETEAI
ncbi:MAG: rhodanese-like domain-containing protein [Zetaproteobacteria bacterium]|nr:rhodanese-like domain-containing protein [Zetaproteobacteria bacterium]